MWLARSGESSDGTTRRQLWADPSGPLPDVYVSETSLLLAEGEATQYTISLTTAPGMREDTTVRGWLRETPACVLLRIAWTGVTVLPSRCVFAERRSTSTTTRCGST